MAARDRLLMLRIFILGDPTPPPTACSAISSSLVPMQKEKGGRQSQAGQSAAETRITAQRQDLTLRNMDLEPIFGLRAQPPTQKQTIHTFVQKSISNIDDYALGETGDVCSGLISITLSARAPRPRAGHGRAAPHSSG